MNKQEKLIVALLFAALVGSMMYQRNLQQKIAEYQRSLATNEVAAATSMPISADAEPVLTTAAATEQPTDSGEEKPSDLPEITGTLANEHCRIELTSKGGGIRSARLLDYRRDLDSPEDEHVELDFASLPALTLVDLPGLGRLADFSLAVTEDQRSAVLRAARPDGLQLERHISFVNGYRLAVKDTFRNGSESSIEVGQTLMQLGPMQAALDADDSSLAADARVQEPRKVVFPEFSKVRGLSRLFGAAGGGCSAARVPLGAPREVTIPHSGITTWAAVRTRFFVQVLTPGQAAANMRIRARRQEGEALRLSEIDAALGEAAFALEPGASLERTYDYYAGPRQMSALRALGADQVRLMRFGTWRIFCGWLLDILNFLYRVIPNYGVAIILLTCLVRLIMLPITKRSSEGMRRMQAMQPKLKEIQTLYKDDPQKQQRETMRLYSEHKVNPLSSCLPMLIQLPIFVALFTVLRSSVELRFQAFLWVADLSSPEGLFRDTLGFSLNILPIAMAGTMALQSYLTPQAGDASQQRMMMVMMPVMMLVMFYNFPSGLALYWTTSQVLAICGLLWVRRKKRGKNGSEDGVEVIPPAKETRQMRRARER